MINIAYKVLHISCVTGSQLGLWLMQAILYPWTHKKNVYMYTQAHTQNTHTHTHTNTQREREKEIHRHRHTHTHRETDTDTGTHRHTDRWMDRQTERYTQAKFARDSGQISQNTLISPRSCLQCTVVSPPTLSTERTLHAFIAKALTPHLLALSEFDD